MEKAFYHSWRNMKLREGCDYFFPQGFDALRVRESVGWAEISRELKTLAEGHLYYFPMGKRELPLLLPQRNKKMLLTVIEELERRMDLVFLDCGTTAVGTYDFLKGKNDLVVMNFCQSGRAFDDFFLRQYDVADRFFYLVGNYHAGSVYNRRNIYRLYRIPSERIGVVPYNPQFEQVCREGKLWRYLSGSATRFAQERDRSFLREMEEISQAVLREVSYGG